MKKRTAALIALIAAILLTALFVPIPRGSYDDGGTREYDAVMYKIIVWNTFCSEPNGDGTYGEPRIHHRTAVYFFPENMKSIRELKNLELERLSGK